MTMTDPIADMLSRVRTAHHAHHDAASLIHIRTLYLRPDVLMVAANFAFGRDRRFVEIARAIDDVEKMVRALVQVARIIYIEPVVYQARTEEPATDVIVIKAAD